MQIFESHILMNTVHLWDPIEWNCMLNMYMY